MKNTRKAGISQDMAINEILFEGVKLNIESRRKFKLGYQPIVDAISIKNYF